MSLFCRAPDDYKRDLDIARNFCEATAFYHSKMTGTPYEESLERTIRAVKEGRITFKDKKMKVNYRNACGEDKRVGIYTVQQYFRRVIKGRKILTPNLNVYENPQVEKSFLSEVLETGFNDRKKAKNKQHEAEMEKRFLEASIYGSEQVNKKTVINSASGAASDKNNPLNCPSAHSALTSTCRTMASMSNMLVESIMADDFVYQTGENAFDDIIARIRLSDLSKVENALNKYGIITPTAEYIKVEMVRWCRYWSSTFWTDKINGLLDKLTPIELSAFYYTNNLLGLIKLNPAVAKTIFNDLTIQKDPEPLSDFNEAKDIWLKADGYVKSYISTCSSAETKGKSSAEIMTDENIVKILGARTKYFTEMIKVKYWDYFESFYITNYSPPNVFEYTEAMRVAVAGGDTDSTFYTTQLVIEEIMGNNYSYEDVDRHRELVGYINSQTMCHNLAGMSETMGVEKKRLFEQRMKPEFAMVVLGITTRSKHYYAGITSKEGNQYEDVDVETKGVGMRSSTVPNWLIKISEKYEEALIRATMEGRKLSIKEALSVPAFIEHALIGIYQSGSAGAYQSVQIKEPDSYKAKEANPVFFYSSLWNEVFGEKYGVMEEFPVHCVKISVDLKNKTAIKDWIDTMDDDMASRATAFFERTGRDNMVMILVPKSFLEAGKVPSEVLAAMDISKILSRLMDSFYYVAETMGFHYRSKKSNRFAYQDITAVEAENNLIVNVRDMFELDLSSFDPSAEDVVEDNDDDEVEDGYYE